MSNGHRVSNLGHTAFLIKSEISTIVLYLCFITIHHISVRCHRDSVPDTGVYAAPQYGHHESSHSNEIRRGLYGKLSFLLNVTDIKSSPGCYSFKVGACRDFEVFVKNIDF